MCSGLGARGCQL